MRLKKLASPLTTVIHQFRTGQIELDLYLVDIGEDIWGLIAFNITKGIELLIEYYDDCYIQNSLEENYLDYLIPLPSDDSRVCISLCSERDKHYSRPPIQINVEHKWIHIYTDCVTDLFSKELIKQYGS